MTREPIPPLMYLLFGEDVEESAPELSPLLCRAQSPSAEWWCPGIWPRRHTQRISSLLCALGGAVVDGVVQMRAAVAHVPEL